MSIRPELREELMGLPPDERLQLADELLQSVPDQVEDADWQKAWADELRRRIEEIRAGEIEGADAEQVFAEEIERLDSSG